MLPA
jgi:hypothetical protein